MPRPASSPSPTPPRSITRAHRRHAYTITAQASDGTLTSSQTFTIGVTDVAPSTPTDSDAAANTVAEGAANGSTVGVTASSTDVNGPAVTYSLVGDTSGGGFTINAATGVVTVADSTKIDFETLRRQLYRRRPGQRRHADQFAGLRHRRHRRRALDARSTATPAANQVAVSAPAGSHRRRHRVLDRRQRPGSDLLADRRHLRRRLHHQCHHRRGHRRRSQQDLSSRDPSYDITVDASDGTLHSQQTFTIAVVLDAAPVVTAGHTLGYTENQAATAIDTALTVTDSTMPILPRRRCRSPATTSTARMCSASPTQPASPHSFNAATGTLTLTGIDTRRRTTRRRWPR